MSNKTQNFCHCSRLHVTNQRSGTVFLQLACSLLYIVHPSGEARTYIASDVAQNPNWFNPVDN